MSQPFWKLPFFLLTVSTFASAASAVQAENVMPTACGLGYKTHPDSMTVGCRRLIYKIWAALVESR
jgi:hypothetical protein